MNSNPNAVSELNPGEAALVNYSEYKKKHPSPPDGREKTPNADGARVLILPPSGVALVDYSQYDLFCLEPPDLNKTGKEARGEAELATTDPLFEKKES